MQVKYIVYYPGPKKAPKVALWLTSDGSMTHVKYMTEHKISPQSLSSLGYVSYSPFWRKYKLEHYQNDEAYSFLDLLHKLRLEKRDKILVQKEIFRNPLLKNPKVQQGTYCDLLRFQKAKENFKAC